jgi:hypothetical protein
VGVIEDQRRNHDKEDLGQEDHNPVVDIDPGKKGCQSLETGTDLFHASIIPIPEKIFPISRKKRSPGKRKLGSLW